MDAVARKFEPFLSAGLLWAAGSKLLGLVVTVGWAGPRRGPAKATCCSQFEILYLEVGDLEFPSKRLPVSWRELKWQSSDRRPQRAANGPGCQ